MHTKGDTISSNNYVTNNGSHHNYNISITTINSDNFNSLSNMQPSKMQEEIISNEDNNLKNKNDLKELNEDNQNNSSSNNLTINSGNKLFIDDSGV